jgi:hypothetical protein
VVRPSLKTTKRSLPGRYSQRKRTLALSALLPELYCTRADAIVNGSARTSVLSIRDAASDAFWRPALAVLYEQAVF